MRNIYLLTKYTLREAFSRKVFLAFAGISTFVILIFLLLFLSVDTEGFQSTFNLPEGNTSFIMHKIVEILQITITIPLYAGGLFLSIFSASGFIPHLLEKGNIDLFLSKPVKRFELILGKYFGGTLVVFINIVYLIIAIWLMMGLKFEVWNFSFLLVIPSMTFSFMVLYSLVIFAGIISQSSMLAMMLAYLVHFVLSPVLFFREEVFEFISNGLVKGIFNVLFYVVPRMQELAVINTNLAKDSFIDDWNPVINSVVFICAAISLSIIIFRKKDF